MVNGAEHRGRIVCLHEGAGAVIDGLARDGCVVSVHHAMDETEQHPLRNQLRLPGDYALQQRPVRLRGLHGLGIVAGYRKVGQYAHAFRVAPCCEVLERAHAQMGRRYPRQHGSGQGHIPQHPLPRGHRGQGARSGHAERRHGLAHNVLTQHGPECGSAIASARERGPAGALELDVVALAVPSNHFTQQVGAAIAELRHKIAELVSGIGLRERLRPFGYAVACQDFHASSARQSVRVQV